MIAKSVSLTVLHAHLELIEGLDIKPGESGRLIDLLVTKRQSSGTQNDPEEMKTESPGQVLESLILECTPIVES